MAERSTAFTDDAETRDTPMSFWRHERSALPGFGLSLGFTVTYLGLIVLIPLSAAFWRTAGMSWADFVAAVWSERVVAAYKLTFAASLAAGLVNAVLGLIVAWVLVRYPFPGRRMVDALVDLPFALPTAVAGIALTTLYAPTGWVGQWLAPLGIKVAFSELGVFVALTLLGYPLSSAHCSRCWRSWSRSLRRLRRVLARIGGKRSRG